VWVVAQLRFISRRHATLHRGNDGALLLEDHGTPNGTFVNGWRLLPGVAQLLAAGDDVRVGGGC
jgi:pSer/pThr/pTyr-binding forkhead associated (FHA) protein